MFSCSGNMIFITFIVINATNNTLAKLLACLKPELRNIFQGIHQPFTNIVSSWDIRWVLATESNTFKRRIREAIEIRLRKPSLNRDNGFELANIYNTILGPLRPLWSDITLRNINISTVADEVRLVRTKYSTSQFLIFIALWVRKYFIILKSCFLSRKTIFLIVIFLRVFLFNIYNV